MVIFLSTILFDAYLGSMASLFLKKASDADGIISMIRNVNLYRRIPLSGISGVEYMDTAVSGLICSATAYIINLYLDYGAVVFDLEGEDYEEENSWRDLDIDRCCVYVDIVFSLNGDKSHDKRMSK